MTVLTIRLPEGKHDRLKALPRARKISVNRLIDELATVALANHDAFRRFRHLVDQGSPQQAMELLDRIDG